MTQPACLIFAGVGDEAGVKLDRARGECAHVGDEVVRYASTTEKNFRDVALGQIDGVDADYRRSEMTHGFKSLDYTKVCVTEYRMSNESTVDARPTEVRVAKVRPTEVRPGEVRQLGALC